MKEGIMKKKAKSTYEEFIEDDKQKALLDKEYKELLVSELLMAAMEHDHISVRKLASASGVSPTIIHSRYVEGDNCISDNKIYAWIRSTCFSLCLSRWL